jgi:hypothetical protein
MKFVGAFVGEDMIERGIRWLPWIWRWDRVSLYCSWKTV